MLEPRIIPCLLLQGNSLVKTVNFSSPKYVGDPLNAVKIFNEKAVDELLLLDVAATVDGYPPNLKLIREIAAECRMPLCYAGGISCSDQISEIISLGVEKVGLGTAAVENPEIITQAVREVGSQSIVAIMDVKRKRFSKNYEVVTRRGGNRTGISPLEFVSNMQALGCGEILINNVDRDGLMQGYDHELISLIRDNSAIPITVLGGAGSVEDLVKVVEEFGVVGVAAGSLFVFKGAYKAVLINYLSNKDRDQILSRLKQ